MHNLLLLLVNDNDGRMSMICHHLIIGRAKARRSQILLQHCSLHRLDLISSSEWSPQCPFRSQVENATIIRPKNADCFCAPACVCGVCANECVSSLSSWSSSSSFTLALVYAPALDGWLSGGPDWLTDWLATRFGNVSVSPVCLHANTSRKKKHNNQIQCDDNQVKFKLLSVNVVPYHSVCIHFISIKCMMHIICLYMCIICIFFCAYNSGRWALWIQFDCFFCPEIKPLENHLIIKQSNNISNWIVYIHDDCCQNARPETCECNSKFAILNLMIQFFQSLKNWTQFYLCVFLNTTGPVYVVIRDINWNGLGIFFLCWIFTRTRRYKLNL